MSRLAWLRRLSSPTAFVLVGTLLTTAGAAWGELPPAKASASPDAAVAAGNPPGPKSPAAAQSKRPANQNDEADKALPPFEHLVQNQVKTPPIPVPTAATAAPPEAISQAEQITRHPTGVGIWRFAPTGNRIYFITADTIDLDEKLRREKRFTVNIRNPESPISSLWAYDVDAKKLTGSVKGLRL